MNGISRLVTEQIPFCARAVQFEIALSRSLTHGESHGAVGVFVSDGRYYAAKRIIVIIRVFPALKDKRAEPERISLVAAGEDLVGRKAKSLRFFVSVTDPALIAVVFTVIREFDKASDKYGVAVYFPSLFVRFDSEFFVVSVRGDQSGKFTVFKVTKRSEFFYDIQNGPSFPSDCPGTKYILFK